MNMQWIGWFFAGTFSDLGRFGLPGIIMGGNVFRFLAGGPLDISLIDPMHVSDSMVPAMVVEAIPPDGWKPSAVALFQSVVGWKPVESHESGTMMLAGVFIPNVSAKRSSMLSMVLGTMLM